jgi:hypothetical protein
MVPRIPVDASALDAGEIASRLRVLQHRLAENGDAHMAQIVLRAVSIIEQQVHDLAKAATRQMITVQHVAAGEVAFSAMQAARRAEGQTYKRRAPR